MDILKNQIALITGGASGIGRATAILFAQEGAAVAIADINEEAGQAVATEIKASGGRALFIPCDVTRAPDCQNAVEATVAAFGRLDILFNNAGIIRRADDISSFQPESLKLSLFQRFCPRGVHAGYSADRSTPAFGILSSDPCRRETTLGSSG